MSLHKLILPILLFAAALSPCLALALVPKQPKQVTRREVVERMAKAALHPPRPRRSSVPGDCTTLPTGTAPAQISTSNEFLYTRYYSGSGFTEDPQNPGNDDPGFPPYTTDIGFLDIHDAVLQCSDLSSRDPLGYISFDLHFLTSTCTWICVQYYDDNGDPSWWDQANPNVAIAYGYHASE